MKTKTKYIFVTGGVISGVGKGIMAASMGAILKAKGLKVSIQKCDPYFNVDAGLLNPREHGECYVTRDGAETDLDLGHYERFLDEEMTGNSIWTSGKLYKTLIDAERSGKFGGKTVQLVPHVTNMVQQTFLDNASDFESDVHIVEIGGTVGDIEGLHFIEAVREFPTKVGRENCLFVHVCYVPWLSTSQEFKTKPAQNSLRDLRQFGIIPDMVVARMDVDKLVKAPQVAAKLATFCGVREDAVVLMPDAKSVYEVPLNAVKSGVLAPLERFIDHGDPDMGQWEKLAARIEAKPKKTVKIGMVAKYVDNTDTYLSVTEALKAAAWEAGVGLETVWINAEDATDADFANVDGIVVPGGFGVRGVKCANSEEFGAQPGKNVVYIMDGQQGKESTGGTMRLGNYPAVLKKGSKLAKIYGTTEVVERHRHRYEVNREFAEQIAAGGLDIAGTSPDGSLVEFVEAPKCDYFVATQGHPEYRSRPYRAHPMFAGLIRAAAKK